MRRMVGRGDERVDAACRSRDVCQGDEPRARLLYSTPAGLGGGALFRRGSSVTLGFYRLTPRPATDTRYGVAPRTL